MENANKSISKIIEKEMDRIRNSTHFPILCVGYDIDEKNQIGVFRIQETYETHSILQRMEWGQSIIAYDGKRKKFLQLDSVDCALQSSGDTYIELEYAILDGKIIITREKYQLLDSYSRKCKLLNKEIKKVDLKSIDT